MLSALDYAVMLLYHHAARVHDAKTALRAVPKWESFFFPLVRLATTAYKEKDMQDRLVSSPVSSASSTRLLLVIHVAERLKLAPRTVRLKAETGELPGFKLSAESRIWYFRESDIETLVEKQREKFLGHS
jgi:hypothetical protein